jgi:hypothetical protein
VQLGQDKQSSAAVRSQSSSMGLTVNQVFLFSVYKFRFLIYIVTWADTATNTQAAQSPGRYKPFYENPNFHNFLFLYDKLH